MSFALSEGIVKYNLIEVEDIEIKDCKKTDNNEELTDKFLVLIDLYNKIACQKSMLNFISNLFELGYMLGYDIHTIANAYYKKCDLVKVMQDKRNVQ
jgi:dimeric dUTPase (all-alpha-NTP-PPase superfamily)